jgi:hypothetical protein
MLALHRFQFSPLGEARTAKLVRLLRRLAES